MIATLNMHQISLTKGKGMLVIRFGSVIACDGHSKTVGGLINLCNWKPVEATI